MEDDGLGNQFFLNMSGPLDTPVYKYDREAAKKHRRNAIDEEKARLLNALKGGSGPLERHGNIEPDVRSEGGRPEPQNRRGRNQNKQDNLLNPDDEDYL